MSEHLGILGALTPDDIAEAFERIRHREAQREQEYRDADQEIESNVIRMSDFVRRKAEKTIGAL
jgi:hypothetical protein